MEAATSFTQRIGAWRHAVRGEPAWGGGLVHDIRTEAARGVDDDTSAIVLRACADALQRMQDVPALQQGEHLDAVDRALQAVADRLTRLADPACAGQGPAIGECFGVYRAVQHIAGAPRVHPADLWPCPDPWLTLPADPFVTPRALDAGALDELESTLLALLRQSGPEPSDRMSTLCAALAEGSGAALPDLWRMAAAAYEGQRDGLIASDVYLKRVGPRLLALAREIAAAPSGQHPGALRARMTPLAHELLFFCIHAVVADEGSTPRLAAVREAHRARLAPTLEAAIELPPQTHQQQQPPPLPQPQPQQQPQPGGGAPQPDAALQADAAPLPAASQPEAPLAAPPPAASQLEAPLAAASGPRPLSLSLVQAVPGLPSMADLDLEGDWPDEEPPPEDIKQIGPLRIPITRFNGFLAESDELARRLGTLLDEWRVEAAGPPPQTAVEAAQALAVEAAAVGHDGLAALCAALADALQRVAAMAGFDPDAAERFGRAHGQLQRLLHTFAAGFLRPVDLDWVAALRDFAAGDDHPAASGASSGLPTHPPALAPVGNLDLSKGLEEPKASDSAQNLCSSPEPAIDGSQETGSGLESPESPEGPADAVVPDNPTEGARPSVSLARDPVQVGSPGRAVEHALEGLRARLRDAGLNPDDILADLERAMAIGQENSTGRG
jgi:hypothetical protein